MNGTQLYVASATFLTDPDRFATAYRTVDASRQQKIDRLRKDSAKRLSLATGLLLNTVLTEHGVSSPLLYAANGKPYLEGSSLHISLSHSGELALLAVSDEEVGCDIECLGKTRLAVAERFFHPQEYRLLQHCASEEERQRLFYRLWTLKESVIKQTGRGLAQGLSTFAILPNGDDAYLTEGDLPSSLFLRSYTLCGYAAAVCSNTPPPNTIQQIALADITEF